MRFVLFGLGLFLACCMPAATTAAEAEGASEKQVSKPAAGKKANSNRNAGLDKEKIQPLLDQPLYKFTEAEVDLYLRYLQASEPDLRRRIVQLARKNVGQPYEQSLLGEMPFESHDAQPLYCLAKSDGLTFGEQTYAMALSHDWPGFMAMLQRIRYRDGRIGVATRNHFIEADWNVANGWLVRDITAELVGKKAKKFKQKVDRAALLKREFKLDTKIPVERRDDIYIPLSEMTLIESQLQDGDFVNVVQASAKIVEKKDEDDEGYTTVRNSQFVAHVGLVANGADGTVNMIHSDDPAVREEPIVDYIARSIQARDANIKDGKPVLLGFKFLRLEADPLANLRKIDGDEAPRVTLPRGGAARL